MTTMQMPRNTDQAGSIGRIGGDAPGRAGAALHWAIDPLGRDEVTDEVVVTTTRRLLRLTNAVADVAARFVRERSVEDPIEWMTVPRRLFCGEAAMDACQDLGGFGRSVVVHGLGLDSDASIDDVERVLEEQDDPAAEADADAVGGGRRLPSRSGDPRLLSCWVTTSGGRGRLDAFCAMVTARPEDLVERVSWRYGAAAAKAADIIVGFDRGDALVGAMIAEEMIDALLLAAAEPRSAASRGLDVVIERRFAA